MTVSIASYYTSVQLGKLLFISDIYRVDHTYRVPEDVGTVPIIIASRATEIREAFIYFNFNYPIDYDYYYYDYYCKL